MPSYCFSETTWEDQAWFTMQGKVYFWNRLLRRVVYKRFQTEEIATHNFSSMPRYLLVRLKIYLSNNFPCLNCFSGWCVEVANVLQCYHCRVKIFCLICTDCRVQLSLSETGTNWGNLTWKQIEKNLYCLFIIVWVILFSAEESLNLNDYRIRPYLEHVFFVVP